MLKNSKVVFYFCHLKKLVRPETFGPYYVGQAGNFWTLLRMATQQPPRYCFNNTRLRYAYRRCKHDTNICFPYPQPLSANTPIQNLLNSGFIPLRTKWSVAYVTSLSSRKLYKTEAHDREVTGELWTPRSYIPDWLTRIRLFSVSQCWQP